jgi:hypothetical protein
MAECTNAALRRTAGNRRTGSVHLLRCLRIYDRGHDLRETAAADGVDRAGLGIARRRSTETSSIPSAASIGPRDLVPIFFISDELSSLLAYRGAKPIRSSISSQVTPSLLHAAAQSSVQRDWQEGSLGIGAGVAPCLRRSKKLSESAGRRLRVFIQSGRGRLAPLSVKSTSLSGSPVAPSQPASSSTPSNFS